MVNVFGDRGASSDGQPGPRGPRGPKGLKGDPGKSGIDDICRWIPDLVLEQFQKHETCCFKMTDPSKDLQVGSGGAYITWIFRSAPEKNAVAIHPSKQVHYISKKQNALVFNKSLYTVGDVVLSPANPNYVYVCVTFQTDGE